MTFQRRSAACTATLMVLVSCLPAFAQTFAKNAVSGPSAALPDDPGYLYRQQPTPAADTSGTIQGVVADAHGGLVPKASVTLEQKGRSALRETTTDSAGHFAFANVAPGTYTVLISAPELKTFLSPPIALAAGEHFELPETALPVAASTSIDVSANSVEVAEEELHREEQQRIVGIIPNFFTSFIFDAAPLNSKQKFKLTTRALIDPTAFIGVAISAGIEQANDTFPGWGNSDAASYGKRYAAGYGDELLTRMFTYAVFPSVLHQDPRYFYLGPTNKTSTRIWHAVSSGIITRGDNGRKQPNYSYVLGTASAGALSSVYHPASDSAGYLAGLNVGVGIGSKAVQALIREFVWPHFTTHVPAYANGKTAPPAAPNP
jgi:hypothetical protein